MDIIEEICNCQNCNLYKNQLPLTDKLHKSNVMWVGLSAKKVKNISEDYPLKENTNSGKIIKTIEERNNEFKYYKTNLVKCLPLNENGNIRYPNKIEMGICIKNLLIEIEKVQPKIIFLLGNIVNDFVIKF